MTPEEKPPSREELAEDVAARLRAGGLNASRDGEDVTVYEQPKTAAVEGGASTGRNLAVVLGATLGSMIVALLLSLVWFSLAFSILGAGQGDAGGVGQRAGVVGFTVAALCGGLGALMTGADRKTPAGERDKPALMLGVVLGAPLLLIAIRSLGMTMDALTSGVGKGGILAAVLFFGGIALVGDRVFKKR